MTAPTDLDNDDRALAGENEMFDLGEGEKDAKRKGVNGIHDQLEGEDGMSDDEAAGTVDEASDDEILDSEDEREYKLSGLEGQLDGLYDEYKERMAERDAKWKVKQARMKDKNFAAWHGIQEVSESDDGVEKKYRDRRVRVKRRNEDDDSGDEDGNEEGGWDTVAAKRAALGEQGDSSDGSYDEGIEAAPKRAKVRFEPEPEAGPSRPRHKPATALVTSLRKPQERAQLSRQAQIWFDQTVFEGMEYLGEAHLDEEEGDWGKNGSESEDEDEDEEVDEDGDVEMGAGSASEEEQIEFVPREKEEEEDGTAWDVDDEDQDETKRKIIQSELFTHYHIFTC